MEIEPRAIYIHCNGHLLNLTCGELVKIIKMIKEAMSYAYEIIKLIKKSTRRDAIFHRILQELGELNCSITSMCPIRWTVRAKSLSTILKNWLILVKTFEESAEEVSDGKMKVRLTGILEVMKKFDVFYGMAVAHLILSQTDNLSKSLQKSDLSASEGYTLAMHTVATLESFKNDKEFAKFYNKIQDDAKAVNVSEPVLPRKRKRNSMLDDYEHDVPEVVEFSDNQEYYKKPYIEALDHTIKGIRNRFNQKGYKTLQKLENLLLKAACGENYDEEFEYVTNFYKSDINPDALQSQLKTFTTIFPKPEKYEKILLIDIIKFMKRPGMNTFLSEIGIVLKLILVLPATNAQSERSFSKMKVVKDHLRTTMKQKRLNHLMICSIYPEELDALSISEIGNEFVNRNSRRFDTFGKFTE